jgi:hypothetical protein
VSDGKLVYFGDVDEERFDTVLEDLRAGNMDAELPNHGTLSRVQRKDGLPARSPGRAEPSPGSGAHRASRRTATPHVDLDTRRTTAAVLPLDGGHGVGT